MRKKLTTICVIAMFILTSSTAVSSLVTKINISEDALSDIKPVIIPSNGYRDYTEGDGVIRIEDNDDFINHPAVTPGGKGTQSQPYIIENWKVKQIIIKYVTVYFEINDCYIYDGYAIYFYQVRNSKIQNCIIERDKGYRGIELKWSSYNIIDNCDIYNYLNAIMLTFHSTNNVIRNCQITDVSYQNEGFGITESDSNEIYNCQILQFDTYGFRLEDSNNNKIHHCTMENGGWYGVYLVDSNNNNVYCCDISECLYGLYIDRCNGNTIYHNSIYNNEDDNVYVSVIGSNNWDNGEEGNYWDDYRGDDNDKNGIGDENYKISNDEEDHYPLIKQYGTPFPPTITGRSEGMITKAYDYFFKTKDHNNDKVYYYIDWGDGQVEEWIGPFKPDVETSDIHIYKRTGEYTIRAKAKDVNGHESDWGGKFSITMPKNKPYIKTPLLSFLQNHPQLFPLLRYLLK